MKKREYSAKFKNLWRAVQAVTTIAMKESRTVHGLSSFVMVAIHGWLDMYTVWYSSWLIYLLGPYAIMAEVPWQRWEVCCYLRVSSTMKFYSNFFRWVIDCTYWLLQNSRIVKTGENVWELKEFYELAWDVLYPFFLFQSVIYIFITS